MLKRIAVLTALLLAPTLAQAIGQKEFQLLPTSETEFFGEAVGGQITFVRDEASSKVMSFIVRQGGQEMTAKRVE